MKLCAHCRVPLERKDIHWDHVPPKCMFPKGTQGIIQVPSCKDCNKGASDHDEHFRLMAVDATANASSTEPRAAAARSLLHPRKEAFRESLERKAVPIEVETPEGTSHGYKVPMSVSRLTITTEKIIRGLYYHHKGYPVPEGFAYPCICLNTAKAELVASLLENVIEPLKTQPTDEIGNGVFRYRYAFFSDEAPHNAIFLMGFYGWVDFVSVVAPLPESVASADWKAHLARRT
jgi:hypothetical protein